MIETQEHNGAFVVRPKLDITASSVEAIRTELQALVAAGRTNLVVDLAEVSIIDSKGLAMLMMCHKSLQARGGRLTVLTSDENLRHLFHIMRLDEHFTVTGSL